MANLITLDEYKEYKGINSPDRDDMIEALITRTSDFIKRFTNKTFIDYAYVNKIEYHDGKDLESVLLEEPPILSVASVKTSTDGGVTQTTLVENTDFFVEKGIAQIISNDASGTFTYLGVGFHSLEVTYKGGYTAVPQDIRQANLDFVTYYLENEYTPKRQFSQMTTENFNFRAESDLGLPGHIQRILEYYREL